MRQFEAVELLAPRKRAFAREIFRRLTEVPGVLSVTFVGSFCDRYELGGISDIDTVVVCESLNRFLFEACVKALAGLTPVLLELPTHRLHLNTTFGPLKFDQPDQVVIHLMIYDRAGHRTHVVKSPFTCFDWERSEIFTGQSLGSIYPVLRLQPGDFLNARRSLSNYADDLRRGVISFREYEFTPDGISERIKQAALDARHRGEYAFHIVKNLVQNYAKLMRRENAALPAAQLVDFWREALPGCCTPFAEQFGHLETAKLRRDATFPTETIDFAVNFMAAFEKEFSHQWGSAAKRLFFTRHAATSLNDGSFLGQGRDPGIAGAPTPLPQRFVKVISSPLRRALETAEALQPGSMPVSDARLTEIDYGLAEGLNIDQLRKQFPEIVAAWSAGGDAAFPKGENTAAVEKRLEAFLKEMKSETASPILVVTHNVVLRCLVGRLLGVECHHWHRLKIGHLDLFEIIWHKGEPHLNLTETQKAGLVDCLLQ